MQALWAVAIDLQASVAIWRLPRSKTLHLLIDFSAAPRQGPLEEGGGFAVSPFVNPGGNKTLLLKPRFRIAFQQDKTSILSSHETPSVFWEKLNRSQGKHQSCRFHTGQNSTGQTNSNKAHFLDQVNKALLMIRQNKLDKVVIARTKKQPLPSDFDPIRRLLRLADQHADAFTSLISIPALGTWMGASPELLVETNRQGEFRTVSLAGTQAYPQDAPLSEAVWKQKEIEEQAMVSRFIVEQFKSLRLREFLESGPRSIRAGSLIHLKTEFYVDAQAIHRPDLGNIMLRLLHPTSAICGMPRAAAQDFIATHEGLERGLYGGFLGPVNMHGETQLYVNLRCMQLSPTEIIIYAGAGITHDSVADKEWQETELKCQSLLDKRI